MRCLTVLVPALAWALLPVCRLDAADSAEDLPVWDQALSSPVFEAIRPSFESFKFPELPAELREARILDLKAMVSWIARKARLLGKGRPVLIAFANENPKEVRPDAVKFRALFDRKLKVALGAQCFRRVRIDTQGIQRTDCQGYNLHSEPLAAFLDKDGNVTLVGPGGVEPQDLLEAMRKVLAPERDLEEVLVQGVQLVKDLQAFAREKAVLAEKLRRLKTATRNLDRLKDEIEKAEEEAAEKEKELLQREKDLFGD